ncbi:hypothetical protein [Bradyrhizobium diazoefficiens]|uniref:hypothetical protein n=1 Tax=Bradyrhizobium diazoefficiens TaxID=1355477 RepID=UPI001FEE42EF|nr:hypothetical protein [Bradyrhizobium diazoefficiens]
MTKANTNAGNLNPLFHPAAHYGSPAEVLDAEELSAPEKRIILSSWASDMYAVESCPALREIPGMSHTVRLADILAALRRLDATMMTTGRAGAASRCGCVGLGGFELGPPQNGEAPDAHADCPGAGAARPGFAGVGRAIFGPARLDLLGPR